MKCTTLKIIVRRAIPVLIGFGLAGMPASFAADTGSMPGMDMSGTDASAPASSSLPVAVTLKPNPPVVGDNTLDVTISNPAGKPVTGIKFKTSVAMTSMDMGTSHPKVKELGNGRYSLVATFSMAGPWRVTLSGDGRGGKVAKSVDFDAGSKTPWQQPQSDVSTPASNPSFGKTSNADMAGMGDMKGMSGMTGGNGMGDMKGMGDVTYPMHLVPRLQEKGVMTVTGNENWKARTGFGHNAPVVGMMDAMMVGGSPMEGMKMAPMNMDFGPSNYTDKGGDSSMAGMDMGGKAMPGMKMGDKPMPGMDMSSSARPSASAGATAGLKVNAAISNPKVGDNKLEVTVMDSKGQPVSGAKITTAVAMTSMDMGTTHPTLKETAKGHYAGAATFSMAGPWRLTLQVTAPGQKTETQSFDFNPKG